MVLPASSASACGSCRSSVSHGSACRWPACGAAAARRGSGLRHRWRPGWPAPSTTCGDADRVGPGQRAARIVDALLHGEVDRLRPLHTPWLTASAASLASMATVRITTMPGTSSMRDDREAGRLEQADRRVVGRVAALVGARQRNAGGAGEVERQVEQHGIGMAGWRARARWRCGRRSGRWRRHCSGRPALRCVGARQRLAMRDREAGASRSACSIGSVPGA